MPAFSPGAAAAVPASSRSAAPAAASPPGGLFGSFAAAIVAISYVLSESSRASALGCAQSSDAPRLVGAPLLRLWPPGSAGGRHPPGGRWRFSARLRAITLRAPHTRPRPGGIAIANTSCVGDTCGCGTFAATPAIPSATMAPARGLHALPTSASDSREARVSRRTLAVLVAAAILVLVVVASTVIPSSGERARGVHTMPDGRTMEGERMR